MQLKVSCLLPSRYVWFILSATSHDLGPYYVQEDPYKLVLLSKDLKRIATASVDFFFTNEELSIVSTDDEGILRVYEYNPQGETGQCSFWLLCWHDVAGRSWFK